MHTAQLPPHAVRETAVKAQQEAVWPKNQQRDFENDLCLFQGPSYTRSIGKHTAQRAAAGQPRLSPQCLEGRRDNSEKRPQTEPLASTWPSLWEQGCLGGTHHRKGNCVLNQLPEKR